MKKILLPLFILGLLLPQIIFSACGGSQKQIKIIIIPDNYPNETSWSLRDAATLALIDSGGVAGDSVCIPQNECVVFTIHDQFGDGICCGFGNGSYTLQVNGVTVASGGQFQYSETVFLNCPQGHDCTNTFTAIVDTMTAPAPETWYKFIPAQTGIYDINTCALGNTCDTKIYIYDNCSGLIIDEGNVGTTFYDDDGCGTNFQSKISAAMTAGTIYYIRIGDFQTSCAGQTINWQIIFGGAIHGCMDTLSCNYNPLATIADTSCVYPPSLLCAAPDLIIVQNEIVNSLQADYLNVATGDCSVGEGCVSGYGLRRIFRFTTHIKNIGNLDYFIGAPDTVGNQFVFDACHGHWHYVGYAEYLLFDQNFHQVLEGFKNGFCVLDLECSGGGTGKYGCGNMGISAGCGDIYSSGLSCQWIDVTSVDTGNYTLVVRVNWDHSPDKLGHFEKSYDNNWAQVCLNIFYDAFNEKQFTVLSNCAVYTDCAGDTFGNAQIDCNNVCNGSGVRGDVDVSLAADSVDVNLYLNGITNETLAYIPCIDLNGDSLITVYDAAKLNGCLLYNNGLHHHPGNYQNTHKHCEFPFGIKNQLDTITFAIANVDWQNKFVDLSVFNPTDYLLAYELKMHGIVVDSVKNLALGNYFPDVRGSSSGHIVGISPDENSLFKQLAPLNFLRVYFSSVTDSQICIAQIIDVVNGNYEQVIGKIGHACEHVPVVSNVEEEISSENLLVIPNPSNGNFDLYLENKSLSGAEIKITDAIGRIVFSAVNQNLSNNFKIDLGENQSGIYLVHVNLEGKSLVKRVVVDKP